MKNLLFLSLLFWFAGLSNAQDLQQGFAGIALDSNSTKYNAFIPSGRVLKSSVERKYSFSNELTDPAHSMPHPVPSSDIIFYDGFGTDKGWEGYEENYWERGVAKIDSVRWNYYNADFQMPDNDFSPSNDSLILGWDIGGCHINGQSSPEKTITSPEINCLWNSHVFLSLRSFSSYYTGATFNIDVFDGFNWHTVWDEQSLSMNYAPFWNYTDNQWVYQEFDVSEYAANNEHFKIRFIYKPHDDTYFPDINIDDVTVFEPEEYDIGIIDVNPYYDVSLQQNIVPSVRVQNFGYGTLTNFQANYSLTDTSGTVVYSETLYFNGTLAQSQDTLLTFPEITLQEQCNYVVNASITLAGDNVAENNLASDMFFANGHTFWTDDFSTDKGWAPLEPAHFNRGEAMRVNEDPDLSITDNYDPAYDLTQNGNNMLLGDNIGDTYNDALGGTHYVYSPVIDCSGKSNVKLDFSSFINTSSNGIVSLQAKQSDGTWTDIWYIFPFWHNFFQYNWTNYRVDVSAYADNNPAFQIRIGQQVWDNHYYGASFDNFMLSSNFDIDLASIDYMPKGTVSGDTLYPAIVIKNLGEQIVDNFSVDYIITDQNNNTVFQSIDDFIQSVSNNTTFYAKSSNYWVPESAGTYYLKSFVSTYGDEYSFNDTTDGLIRIAEPNYEGSKIYTYLATGNNEQFTAMVNLDCVNSDFDLQVDQSKIGYDFFSSADFIGNKLIAFRAFTQTMYVVWPNGETYEYWNVQGLGNGIVSFGYNTMDHKVYYLAVGTDNYILYRQSVGDETLEPVMDISSEYSYSSMAINSKGEIFATANVENSNGYLLKIDYQNNQIISVGEIATHLAYSQGLGFDKSTDILYGTLFEAVGSGQYPFLARVYQIDTATAELYPLSSYFPGGEQMSYCVFSPENQVYLTTFTILENGNAAYGDSIYIDGQQLATNSNGNASLPLKSGIYKYTITSNSCDTATGQLCFFDQAPDEITVNLDCTTDIDEDATNNLLIYPNPANKFINIIAEKPSKLIILDMTGSIIIENKLITNTNIINISSFNKGVYIFKLLSRDETVFKKIIVR